MKSDNLRNRELAQIHIARQQLGLDDDTYRDMLWTVGRVRSAAELDHAGRRRVIEHLKARGFRLSRRNNEWAFVDRASEDKRPLLRKIIVLCTKLGVGKSYAEGVARRQHGVDRKLEMMNYQELWMVVGALENTRMHKELGR